MRVDGAHRARLSLEHVVDRVGPQDQVFCPSLVRSLRPADDLARASGRHRRRKPVWLGPRLASRLSWKPLLIAALGLAALWSISLALVDGVDALTIPLTRDTEYLRLVPDVKSVRGFIGGLAERLSGSPLHVQGHHPQEWWCCSPVSQQWGWEDPAGRLRS